MEFIKSFHENKNVVAYASYSRNLDHANEFVENNDLVMGFDDYQEFLKSEIDIVYIAIPNSIHYDQSKLAIENKNMFLLKNQLPVLQID